MQPLADYELNDKPWYINEISLALRGTLWPFLAVCKGKFTRSLF